VVIPEIARNSGETCHPNPYGKFHGVDATRWRLVEALYFDVLSLPTDSRAAWLDERCDGDSDLKREVESLLASRDRAEDFLSHGDLVDQIADLAAEPQGLPVPSALGPYQVQSRLGAGAMGEVYRARDSRLDRDVALKILPSPFTNDRARVSRFQLEAKAASALNHPNIVAIYEIGQAEGLWFIAAELVDGVTLRERVAGGPLASREVLDIALQTANALNAAHRAGILHRDVKPENIMLREDGTVKVLDFGLARVTEDRRLGAPHATQSGAVLGTPRYMSPEQARREPLDARSDLFSLGAVLFELLTGRPAFPGATMAEVFHALLATDAVDLGQSGLERVVAKTLRKTREERYQTLDKLIADLKRIDPARMADEERGAASKESATDLPRQRVVAAAVGGLMLAALVGVAYRAYSPGSSDTTRGALELVSLTTFKGAKDFAIFSPDGKEIAFAWTGDRDGVTQRNIYKKSVTGEPVRLTEAAADDTWPVWSPDGREVAFVRAGSSVYVVPADGGAARLVVDQVGLGVAWLPDGRSLVIADAQKPLGSGGLFVLALDTGARRTLTAPDDGFDRFPAVSPDGQRVVFRRMFSDPDLFVVPIAGGAIKQLTFDLLPKLGRLTWTPDGREIVYSTQREFGGAGLWRIPADGGTPRRVANTLLFAGNPSLARDGHRLAYTESWVDTNIYVSEGDGAPRRLIASTREDHSPTFSPDGERIAFISNRTGDSEVWVARLDGSQQTQLTRLARFAGTPRWSPDGTSIAFDLLGAGNSDIWVVASAGGTPRRLTTLPEADNKPAWSPDGGWIYFSSRRSGREEIWKMKPDGSAQAQVTFAGAREGLPSADGKTLYYTKAVAGAIWMVPADGGQERPVEGLEAFANIGRAWGVRSDGIFFLWAEPGRTPGTLRFFDFATRQVATLGEWTDTSPWTGPAVTFSPDTRLRLSVHTDQQINDLMMIENFR
jgi:Tol biopolymer transport system component/serine/threonine protein kinase